MSENEIYKISKQEAQTCSSDMLTVLNNLELMFEACRRCVNDSASRAIMMGMAIEAETLAIKMHTMLERWKLYLPFKEVIDVKFEVWMAKVSEWSDVLDFEDNEKLLRKYPWFAADSKYMIDLYDILPEAEENPLGSGQMVPVEKQPFYTLNNTTDFQVETSDYMQRVDDLLEEMDGDDNEFDGWRSNISGYVMDILCERFVQSKCMPYGAEYTKVVRQKIEDQFDTIRDLEDAQACCVMALGYLQNALIDLQALFDKALSSDQFIRLSTRLFYRHCVKDYQDGERQVTKWKNAWPEARMKVNSKKKIEELKKYLQEQHYGQELSEYLNFEAPNLFGDASFGKFLFNGRHELTVKDIQFIHRICREITLLNEMAGDMPKSEVINSAPMRQLTEQELQILNKLLQLVKKGNWENTTEENIATGLQRALGVGAVLPKPEQVEQSNQFWELLKHRRGCDAEKSLMVAWLNFVGYCVKRGFLSGGSPALCKSFFPKCHQDDYKAIDKGKSGEVKSVRAIYSLLDMCVK